MPSPAVIEASETYAAAMRNVAPAGSGVCAVCWTFIDPGRGYPTCYRCHTLPQHLRLVVPITYSVALGQMHTALRGYKDDPPEIRGYPTRRLLAVLWRFLEAHEACVARASGVGSFDMVTVVPSSTSAAEAARGNLRVLVRACRPVGERFHPLLAPASDAAPSNREYSLTRYESTEPLGGANVLLIDDTWTTGAHAQSAAATLIAAGANTVSAVVIGRHLNPGYAVGDATCGERWDALPRAFNWDTCAVHQH